MNKKSKIIFFSLLGTILISSTIGASVALVSCNNNSNSNNNGNQNDIEKPPIQPDNNPPIENDPNNQPPEIEQPNDIFSNYKPSEFANNLFSKTSFNNTKAKFRQWINTYNDLFKTQMQNPNCWYQDWYCQLDSFDFIGDILKIKVSEVIIYKIPIIIEQNENSTALPDGMSLEDVTSYIVHSNLTIKIDLAKNIATESNSGIVSINDINYPMSNNSNVTNFNNQTIKIYLALLESGAWMHLFEYSSINESINLGNLPTEQVNKLYDIVCNLIKITPTTPDNIKIYDYNFKTLINLDPDIIDKSIEFTYHIYQNSSVNDVFYEISYGFTYDSNTNSWILKYDILDWSLENPVVVDKTIANITDLEITNFFKEILDNSTIMDVDQIKKQPSI